MSVPDKTACIVAVIAFALFTGAYALNAQRAPTPVPNTVSLTSTNLQALQQAEATLEAGDPTITLDIEADTSTTDGKPRYHLYLVN